MYTHHGYPETCVTDLWECVHPSCACRRNPQTAVETWAPGTSGVPSSSRGLFFLTRNPLVQRIERPQAHVHTWCRYPMQGLKPQGSCGDLLALCWAPPGPPIYFCVGGVGSPRGRFPGVGKRVLGWGMAAPPSRGGRGGGSRTAGARQHRAQPFRRGAVVSASPPLPWLPGGLEWEGPFPSAPQPLHLHHRF